MQFFWKKQQSVIDRIKSYLEQVDNCRAHFTTCMTSLIREGASGQETEAQVDRVHAAESRADDLRRDIERELYQRALIPESRGDVLGLLESFDRIPGDFESLCFQISLQHIRFPAELQARSLNLVEVNVEAYDRLRVAVENLFFNRPIADLVREIDQLESDSDRIERAMIRQLFESDMDKADRILIKEVIVDIGDISDLAQSTADRLSIAVAKRRI